MSPASTPIFPPWHFDQWNAVDDRVRGGSSTSHLDPVEVPTASSEKGKQAARFWGHLDIDTLGGAGFASQRYRFGPRPLSLPPLQYRGITLKVQPDRPSISSSKPHRAEIFTLVLKTTLPTSPPSKPKNPPSPEPASLSYEISFTPSSALSTQRFDLDFDDFKAVYRGREVKRDDPRYQPLHTEEIYELSFMCRSDFAAQKGDFSVIVHSLEGWKKDKVAKGERGGLVGVLSAIWVGLVAWVWSFFSGTEGRIALHDEEKDPLI